MLPGPGVPEDQAILFHLCGPRQREVGRPRPLERLLQGVQGHSKVRVSKMYRQRAGYRQQESGC